MHGGRARGQDIGSLISMEESVGCAAAAIFFSPNLRLELCISVAIH